ncbi:PepSY-like domain-containing protein [Haloflavibacter putidus]|uniref:Putative beta-lactamase-inhibitor-like PepSY-like domain-containing protein n=1 Tax=Haloflavibacter putidus TaxID=2576776 RepID=A0A507ZSJ8_9FLAO|nr:PepSY-like domain-containing protein [Haloflavibacter putidus]TQD40610.1 hypothetical protein FKR84_01130 [Haloflavibacter putidus]
MKTKIFVLSLLFIAFTACSDDDQNATENSVELSQEQIPGAITTYVETNFATHSIEQVFKESNANQIEYAVFLSQNVQLEFNEALEITQIDAQSALPNAVIPQSILDYVAANYPNQVITDWELEATHQEVELDNGLELEFDLDGNFLGIDQDQDDMEDENEEVLADAEIPSEILDFINTHFASSTIIKAVKETEDNQITYEIYLSGNVQLEFNQALEITQIDALTALPNSVLPQSILDYVAANYPDQAIIGWELEANYQEIELANGLELEFDLNGNFIGVDEDEDESEDENEEVLEENEIPSEILDFINTHFASSTLIKAIKETEDNQITYEIYLSGNVQLEFNQALEVVEIDSLTALPNSVLPQNIVDYVAANYPNQTIVGWELEANQQKVELSNETDLIFDLNANFIGVD